MRYLADRARGAPASWASRTSRATCWSPRRPASAPQHRRRSCCGRRPSRGRGSRGFADSRRRRSRGRAVVHAGDPTASATGSVREVDHAAATRARALLRTLSVSGRADQRRLAVLLALRRLRHRALGGDAQLQRAERRGGRSASGCCSCCSGSRPSSPRSSCWCRCSRSATSGARAVQASSAAIYFAALGLGFMFFEVSLIQQLTLFLGYPTYSLTVTLFALLVSTGVGSLLSERWLARRNRASCCSAARWRCSSCSTSSRCRRS